MHGLTDPAVLEADAVRQRALDLLERLLRTARDGLRHFEEHEVSFAEWPQEIKKALGPWHESSITLQGNPFRLKREGEEIQPPTREW